MNITHKIEYSAEHVHVVFDGDIDTETCFLSRNWNRCTADDHTTLEAFERVTKNGVVKYYNGNTWQRISGDAEIPQHTS